MKPLTLFFFLFTFLVGNQTIAVHPSFEEKEGAAFASYGAARIGQAFDPEKSVEDYVAHKTAHGLLGAATGLAMTGDGKGAASGALGAVMAEVVAEQIVDRKEIQRSVKETAQREGWEQDRREAATREQEKHSLQENTTGAGGD